MAFYLLFILKFWHASWKILCICNILQTCADEHTALSLVYNLYITNMYYLWDFQAECVIYFTATFLVDAFRNFTVAFLVAFEVMMMSAHNLVYYKNKKCYSYVIYRPFCSEWIRWKIWPYLLYYDVADCFQII